MKKSILFTYFIAFTFLAGAQDLPNVVPPSPEAQAFQKYGDIPVSNYTGVPNISIPLHAITEGDISAPVSISYHASGIRVSEEASRVGLGFVLNAGGMISRTVVGKDDFGQLNTYHNGNIPVFPMGSDQALPIARQVGYEITFPGVGLLNLDEDFVNNTGEVYDFQPDQYSYNFMGYSGKFILKPNKEVILSSREKVEITCMDEDANTWEIRTPDGMHYFFEVYDSYVASNNQPVKSTWYLTKVKSPRNNEINFDYSVLDTEYIRPLGSFSDINYEQSAIAGGPCNPVDRSVFNAVPGKEYSRVRLESISSDLGILDFIYGNRTDLIGDFRLDNIEIYKKVNGVKEGYPFKGFRFNYDYFVTGINGKYNNTAEAKRRLKLISINELGYDGGVTNTNPPYKFTYEESVNLPSKTSFSRDHWGYYNGKANMSLIPNYTVTTSQQFSTASLIGILGAERETNPNFAKAGSLKEITYPTGGSTEFEFESHDYDASNSYINNTNYSQPSVEKRIPLTYDASVYAGTVYEESIDLRDMYVDDEGNISPTKVKGFFRISTNCSDLVGVNPDAWFAIYKEGVNSPLWRTSISNTVCGANYEPFFSFDLEYVLPPGRYVWKAYVGDGPNETQIEDIQATYTYLSIDTPQDNEDKYYFAGGLRINQIIQKDNINPDNDIVTTYDYHYKADNNQDGIDEEYSNGVLMSYPRYSYFEPEAQGACRISYLVRSSDSAIPLSGYPNDISVGYSQVAVYKEGAGENGKTVFTYHNDPNTPIEYNYYSNAYNLVVPARPPVKPLIGNRINGLLKYRVDYTNEGGILKKVRELQNDYNTPGNFNYYNAYFAFDLRRLDYGASWEGPDTAYIYPAIISSFTNLTGTRERTYDPQDNINFVQVNTTYNFNHDTHLQLSSKTISDSKGREVSSFYYYPDDVISNVSLGLPNLSSNSRTAIDFLKVNAQHRVNEVVQVQTSVTENGAVLSNSISRIDFKVFQSSIVLPEFISSLKGTYNATTDPLEGRIVFYDYDVKGNPIEVSNSGGSHIYYVWGYSQEYPIAKIDNLESSQVNTSVQSLINAAMTASNADTDNCRTPTCKEQQLREALNDLRDSQQLSRAMVTTYTYDPLVGVTSMTDPRGYTIYYEYDEFNRLKAVKDAEGNLVTDYEYGYKQPVFE